MPAAATDCALVLFLLLLQQAATATSNILVFMCSSAAALVYLLSGRLETNYAAVYCSVCGAASVMGLTVVGRVIKATGHPSVVVLLLAFIMGAGGLVSGILGFMDAWEKHQSGGGADGFKSIC
jgi:FtsH-binding integral membrane protein